ncbi:MAG: sterol desaturase family protein [Alphaproteobacteria bacterium]|nr:sterol desaturase family protein [Alphaproteobacteria bacterium]
MALALLTTLPFVLLNLVALAVSWRLEHHPLPAEATCQTAARRPGDLRRRLPLVAVNLLLVSGGTFVGTWLLSPHLSTGWPGWGAWVGQFLLLLVVDDLVFYGVHRLLHEHRGLYRLLHARHHEAYAPLPVEILYTHPAETSLVSLGIVAGAALVHLVFGGLAFGAFLSYVIFRHLHELDVHSGMRSRLAHAIPLLAPNEHHDHHHHRPHEGNYASMLTLWDRVFGTHVEDRRRPRQAPRGGLGVPVSPLPVVPAPLAARAQRLVQPAGAR